MVMGYTGDDVPFRYEQADHATDTVSGGRTRTCALCREDYIDRRGGVALCNVCSSEGASYERKLVRERNRTGRVERLKERRMELIRRISPDESCQKCGAKPSDPSQLHIDHEDGKTYRSRRLSLSQRIARYTRELAAGVKLRVLCQHCNCGHLNNSWRAS